MYAWICCMPSAAARSSISIAASWRGAWAAAAAPWDVTCASCKVPGCANCGRHPTSIAARACKCAMPSGLTSAPTAASTASPPTGPRPNAPMSSGSGSCLAGRAACWARSRRPTSVCGELAGPRHRVRDGPAAMAARLHAEVDLADRPSLDSAAPEPPLLRPGAGRGARREPTARLLEPPAVQSRALRGISASAPRNRAGPSGRDCHLTVTPKGWQYDS